MSTRIAPPGLEYARPRGSHGWHLKPINGVRARCGFVAPAGWIVLPNPQLGLYPDVKLCADCDAETRHSASLFGDAA